MEVIISRIAGFLTIWVILGKAESIRASESSKLEKNVWSLEKLALI